MAEPLVVCFRYRKLKSEGWYGTRLSVVYWVGTPLDTSVDKHLVRVDVTGAKVVKGGHSVTDYDELSFRTIWQKNSVANGGVCICLPESRGLKIMIDCYSLL